MATQYTNILKLALPVQGELSGTWGDVVNDNITSMVEEAIAGRKVINSWTANSHTLTIADGTTSESRAAILSLTDSGSALTGAGTVICPAASKVYIVENGTGEDITVKTSSGTGVVIPDGKNMVVFCDGTNVEQGITNVSGAFGIDGVTTITAASAAPLNINRTTSEGSFIVCLEDNSQRLNIAVRNDLPYMLQSSKSGLVFDTDAVCAVTNIGPSTGLPENNATDLGKSTAAWKDLYLGGGLYVGGTGAANKLDDYEEGTWTASLIGSTSGTLASSTDVLDAATYTKIGNMVYAEVSFLVDGSSSTASGNIVLDGLPFVAVEPMCIASVTNTTAFTFDEADISILGALTASTNDLTLTKGSSNSAVTNSDVVNSNLLTIYISVAYRVS